MKRRGKNLKITLLLSAVLVSTNVGYAYAQESPLLGIDSALEDASSGEGASVGADLSNGILAGDAVDKNQTGQNLQMTPTEEGTQTGQTDQGSQTTPTEQDAQITPEQPEEGSQTTKTPEDSNEVTESQDTEDGASDGEEEETQNPETSEENTESEDNADDTAASDRLDTGKETGGDVFVNQSGEEIIPSALVGVDYTTIADRYDGSENVLKQYVLSDEYAENTIMNSYLDENGNLIMIISQGAGKAAVTDTADTQDTYSTYKLGATTGSSSSPAVDGSFSGWDDIPVSYEYNWDNSVNCWYGGEWAPDPETGKNTCYKTEHGTYDNNVRHEMQLFADGENVYLRITYATIYGAHANGEDFQFYIDGVDTKFQVTWADGTPITGSAPQAGTYVVDVRNGNYDPSFSIVDGASAYYRVTETGVNNQLEIKIPMEAFQAQNGKVNLDNYNKIEFTTPNLMYERIAIAGSSTGAVPFAAAAFLMVPAGYVWMKRKDKEEMAFA